MSLDEQPPLAAENGGEPPELPPIDGEELQDRCFDLLHQGMTRRHFATEVAQLVGEASGAKGVAVLTYSRRKRRLSLLADYGLNEEAREGLEGGAQYTWDIPIRGLRNRRISVIEAAHHNPFVPAALVAFSPEDLTVACIPIYFENLPAAAVLLFYDSQRPLTDADLHAITMALRVSARGLREGTEIVTAPERVTLEMDADGEASDDLAVRRDTFVESDGEEVLDLRRSLAAAQEQKDALGARLERAEEELNRVRIEVERGAQTARSLTSSRQALAQERDRLRAELEEGERGRETGQTELRAEVSALEDRLLVAEADRLRHQRAADQLRSGREQSVLALEHERDGLLERVRAAESGTAAVQGALGAVREDRDRLAAQAEALGRQIQSGQAGLEDLRAQHEQAVAALAADRDSLQEQAATLQSELGARLEQRRDLERELRETQAARDAAADQLLGARGEVDRLATLHREALERAQQAEAARAAGVAEGDSRRETVARERAEQQRAEQALRGDLEAERRATERATAAARAQQARLVDLERVVGEREAQIQKLQQERELLGQDAASIQKTLAGLETQAAQRLDVLVAERDGLLGRLQQAEQNLAGENERAQAESKRAAELEERLAQFQESLAQAESRRTDLAGQLAQAQTEVEALRGQSADSGQLARQVTELSSKLIEHQKLLEAAREESRQTQALLAEAERQRAALAKGLQAANRERNQATAVNQRELETLREAVAQRRDEQRQWDKAKLEQAEALQAERTTHAAALAETQATLEQLRAERDRAVAERDQHAGKIAAAQVEVDARTTQALQDTQGVARKLAERERRIDELSDLLRQRDTALERTGEERRDLSGAVNAAETAMLELRREVESVRNDVERQRSEHSEAVERLQRVHKAEVQLAQRAAEDREAKARSASLLALEERRAARFDAPLIIERSDDKGMVIESVPASVEAAQEDLRAKLGEGDIVVLDRGALCEDAVAVLKGAGVDASGAEPTEAGIEALASRSLGAIVLNVASGPPAWQLVRKLREREETRNVPILAYLMNPEAAHGFCFGRCEFGLWPDDLSRLVEVLRRMRPMVRRVLIASSDVEALGRAREPLAKAHISASNVLDGKQARDLGHSLQPEAAVLHFSPTCSDIARALGAYRQIEATRDLPMLLLLDKTGSARESIFFQAASRELLRTGQFDFSQLADELVRLRTPR